MSPGRPGLSFSLVRLAWFIRGGLGVGVGGVGGARRLSPDLRRVLTGELCSTRSSDGPSRFASPACSRAAVRSAPCNFCSAAPVPVPVEGDVACSGYGDCASGCNSPCGVFCSHLIDQARQDWTPPHQFCDVDFFRVCHGVLQEGIYGLSENRRLLDGPLILPALFRAHRGYVAPALRQNAFLAALRAPENRSQVLFRPFRRGRGCQIGLKTALSASVAGPFGGVLRACRLNLPGGRLF